MSRNNPETGAAAHVMAIVEQLEREIGDVATVDVQGRPGYLADLIVTPHVRGALTISVVGMGAGYVVTVGDSGFIRAELENTSDGRQELAALIAGAIEGRGWSKKRKYPPYR